MTEQKWPRGSEEPRKETAGKTREAAHAQTKLRDVIGVLGKRAAVMAGGLCGAAWVVSRTRYSP